MHAAVDRISRRLPGRDTAGQHRDLGPAARGQPSGGALGETLAVIADDDRRRPPRQQRGCNQLEPGERQARRHQQMALVKAALLARVDDRDLAAVVKPPAQLLRCDAAGLCRHSILLGFAAVPFARIRPPRQSLLACSRAILISIGPWRYRKHIVERIKWPRSSSAISHRKPIAHCRLVRFGMAAALKLKSARSSTRQSVRPHASSWVQHWQRSPSRSADSTWKSRETRPRHSRSRSDDTTGHERRLRADAPNARSPGSRLARRSGHRNSVSFDDQLVGIAAWHRKPASGQASKDARGSTRPPHTEPLRRPYNSIRRLPQPRPTRRSSPALADKGMQSRSPTDKSPPSQPLATSGWRPATRCRFKQRASRSSTPGQRSSDPSLAPFRLPEFAPGVKVATGSLEGGGDVRRTTRAAGADARDAAFLGRHARRRIAAAALQRLRQGLFSAAPVLPGLRLARRSGVPRLRQGTALQLCDPPPPGAGLHPALCDRRRRTGRGAAA